MKTRYSFKLLEKYVLLVHDLPYPIQNVAMRFHVNDHDLLKHNSLY